MEIPGLGTVHDDGDWYASDAVPVPALANSEVSFLLSGYGDDAAPDDFGDAVTAFLALDELSLQAAAGPHILAYYEDVRVACPDEDLPVIERAEDFWRHVQFGCEALVQRSRSDQRVYVSLECNCDWEVEHGLNITLRDGREVAKVDPYDGHLTNASAYGRDDLADVVYVRATDL